MRSRLMSVVSFAVLSVAAVAIAADVYKVDPVHSSIMFRVQHANAGYVFGRFDKFAGNVTVDQDPSKMAFEFTVQIDSVDSGNAKRDTHLKSPDFFSASEFPQATFKSTSVKSAGENKFEVAGNFTLHGQTKPLTVTIQRTGGSTTPMFGTREGYLSTFTVKRSDFGMSGMTQVVGDEIEITVAVEAQKQ